MTWDEAGMQADMTGTERLIMRRLAGAPEGREAPAAASAPAAAPAEVRRGQQSFADIHLLWIASRT